MNYKPRHIDLTGIKFNLLTAISFTQGTKKNRGKWKCICDCGQETFVVPSNLTLGRVQSCGCLKITSKTTHGYSDKIPEYDSWLSMRQRCNNTNSKRFKDWGGRGICICKRWDSFDNFFLDMGKRPTPKHTLDRFPNNNGNYSPDNCRWATSKEQNTNKRSNKWYSYNGDTLYLSEWLTKYKISRTNYYRLAKTMSFESIIKRYTAHLTLEQL